MTEKLEIKINKQSLNISENNSLSIQFSLDGFSFCINDNETNKTKYFFNHTFEETLKSPEKLLEKIQVIFEEDRLLQKDFKSIQVIHQNYLSSLVPNAYFDASLLRNYLDVTVKTLKNDFIAFDDLEKIAAKNVYIPYININNYLFQSFGEFEYKHHQTVLIEKIIQKKDMNKVMYVNVAKNNFDIIVTENQELLFVNSFSFNTKEDFMYYVLFTAEQLELDTEQFLLTFSGLISEADEIYKITYKYIRNIGFIHSENPFALELKEPQHTNYTLLG